MVKRLVISKVIDLILNLRHLGFTAASWEDVLAAAGTLSLADRTELSELLIAAGASMSSRGWDFGNLDVEILRPFPIEETDDTLVSIIMKTEAGAWWRTAAGKAKFVKDPNFSFSDVGNDDNDSGLGYPKPNDPNRGKLDLGL